MSNSIKIIAITGGSGSGKTTFAKKLRDGLKSQSCDILYQDSYYIDQSHEFDFDGGSINFDHPNAIDFNLMNEHLCRLKKNENIEVPHYDFSTHTRSQETSTFNSKPIIIVDGILILSQEKLRKSFDYTLFIDCEEKTRFARRLKRDTQERGRTSLGVHNQFLNQVKPMHDEFVEPSKAYADKIVSQENFDQELDSLLAKIST